MGRMTWECVCGCGDRVGVYVGSYVGGIPWWVPPELAPDNTFWGHRIFKPLAPSQPMTRKRLSPGPTGEPVGHQGVNWMWTTKAQNYAVKSSG